MVTRLIAATVAGGIAFFALGFVIYGLLLDPLVMKPNMNEFPGLTNEVPKFIPLILANLVSALLLAYIFEVWAGIRTFVGGLKGGAIVFFLFALSTQLMFISFWNLTKNFTPNIADVIGATVMGAIGGGVIAAVLGMMTKAPAGD
jgi:hypothetical protein